MDSDNGLVVAVFLLFCYCIRVAKATIVVNEWVRVVGVKERRVCAQRAAANSTVRMKGKLLRSDKKADDRVSVYVLSSERTADTSGVEGAPVNAADVARAAGDCLPAHDWRGCILCV
jgi:hypothetical protein